MANPDDPIGSPEPTHPADAASRAEATPTSPPPAAPVPPVPPESSAAPTPSSIEGGPKTAPTQAIRSKLASDEAQQHRSAAIGQWLGVSMFVVLFTVPLLNILVGMFLFLWLAMAIFARSAQRGADFFWLFAGGLLCLFGFGLPAIGDALVHSIGMGFFFEAILNLLVCVFVLDGRLGHLLKGDTAQRPA